MIVVTIYNSRAKIQGTFESSSFRLASAELAKVKGKSKWYARLEYEDGDSEIFHYSNGEWNN